jgi:predicted nucleotidyltransferase
MKTLEEIRAILIEHQQILRERYGVRDLAIFGSYARGEQTRISDVDLLVRLERPIGLKFFELWDYLEEILGLKVDLLTSGALPQKPDLWKHVREDLLYVWPPNAGCGAQEPGDPWRSGEEASLGDTGAIPRYPMGSNQKLRNRLIHGYFVVDYGLCGILLKMICLYYRRD